LKVAKKVEQVKQDLGSVERVFSAAIQRHFKGVKVQFDRLNEFVDQQIATSPERAELGQSSAADLADLSRRAKELLESTETRLGISPRPLIDIMQAASATINGGTLQVGTLQLPTPQFNGALTVIVTPASPSARVQAVARARQGPYTS
jgi:hypothetical protein